MDESSMERVMKQHIDFCRGEYIYRKYNRTVKGVVRFIRLNKYVAAFLLRHILLIFQVHNLVLGYYCFSAQKSH